MPELAWTDHLRQDLLTVRATDPRVATALAEAAQRLDRAARGTAGETGLWPGLAALATGNVPAARALLPHGDARAAGAYFAWTGEASFGSSSVGAVDPRRSAAPPAGVYPPDVIARAPGAQSWTAFVQGRAEEGLRSWLATVDEAGFAEPAALVLPLVHGLIGVEPDSPLQRLRLAPCIPAAWPRFEAERIRVGDADVSLRYEREASRHTYSIEQDSGAIPLTLIFEPLLPAQELIAARVDGRTARLDTRAVGRRLQVPLQIVLDHERTVELHVADNGNL